MSHINLGLFYLIIVLNGLIVCASSMDSACQETEIQLSDLINSTLNNKDFPSDLLELTSRLNNSNLSLPVQNCSNILTLQRFLFNYNTTSSSDDLHKRYYSTLYAYLEFKHSFLGNSSYIPKNHSDVLLLINSFSSSNLNPVLGQNLYDYFSHYGNWGETLISSNFQFNKYKNPRSLLLDMVCALIRESVSSSHERGALIFILANNHTCSLLKTANNISWPIQIKTNNDNDFVNKYLSLHHKSDASHKINLPKVENSNGVNKNHANFAIDLRALEKNRNSDNESKVSFSKNGFIGFLNSKVFRNSTSEKSEYIPHITLKASIFTNAKLKKHYTNTSNERIVSSTPYPVFKTEKALNASTSNQSITTLISEQISTRPFDQKRFNSSGQFNLKQANPNTPSKSLGHTQSPTTALNFVNETTFLANGTTMAYSSHKKNSTSPPTPILEGKYTNVSSQNNFRVSKHFNSNSSVSNHGSTTGIDSSNNTNGTMMAYTTTKSSPTTPFLACTSSPISNQLNITSTPGQSLEHTQISTTALESANLTLFHTNETSNGSFPVTPTSLLNQKGVHFAASQDNTTEVFNTSSDGSLESTHSPTTAVDFINQTAYMHNESSPYTRFASSSPSPTLELKSINLLNQHGQENITLTSNQPLEHTHSTTVNPNTLLINGTTMAYISNETQFSTSTSIPILKQTSKNLLDPNRFNFTQYYDLDQENATTSNWSLEGIQNSSLEFVHTTNKYSANTLTPIFRLKFANFLNHTQFRIAEHLNLGQENITDVFDSSSDVFLERTQNLTTPLDLVNETISSTNGTSNESSPILEQKPTNFSDQYTNTTLPSAVLLHQTAQNSTNVSEFANSFQNNKTSSNGSFSTIQFSASTPTPISEQKSTNFLDRSTEHFNWDQDKQPFSILHTNKTSNGDNNTENFSTTLTSEMKFKNLLDQKGLSKLFRFTKHLNLGQENATDGSGEYNSHDIGKHILTMNVWDVVEMDGPCKVGQQHVVKLNVHSLLTAIDVGVSNASLDLFVKLLPTIREFPIQDYNARGELLRDLIPAICKQQPDPAIKKKLEEILDHVILDQMGALPPKIILECANVTATDLERKRRRTKRIFRMEYNYN